MDNNVGSADTLIVTISYTLLALDTRGGLVWNRLMQPLSNPGLTCSFQKQVIIKLLQINKQFWIRLSVLSGSDRHRCVVTMVNLMSRWQQL